MSPASGARIAPTQVSTTRSSKFHHHHQGAAGRRAARGAANEEVGARRPVLRQARAAARRARQRRNELPNLWRATLRDSLPAAGDDGDGGAALPVRCRGQAAPSTLSRRRPRAGSGRASETARLAGAEDAAAEPAEGAGRPRQNRPRRLLFWSSPPPSPPTSAAPRAAASAAAEAEPRPPSSPPRLGVTGSPPVDCISTTMARSSGTVFVRRLTALQATAVSGLRRRSRSRQSASTLEGGSARRP